jgi:hypothetical protein
MKRLISRSGSTAAKILCILLLLELSFVVVESESLAQSAKDTAASYEGPSPQVASLSETSLNEKSSSPASQPEINSAIALVEAKAISLMLLASLEAKLKQWQDLSGLEQPTARVYPGGEATPDVAYVNQKIAALDRMIKLFEQKKAVQAAAGVYQERLEVMQNKIQAHENAKSNPKLE